MPHGFDPEEYETSVRDFPPEQLEVLLKQFGRNGEIEHGAQREAIVMKILAQKNPTE